MSERETAARLLEVAGTTYAAQAGIVLRDQPAPLYRLLVLSVLLSTRIKADIAVAACKELAEFGTPDRMLAAEWQQRVDALGRGHYVRYDESTATALGEGAELLRTKYGGDLRRLRHRAEGDLRALRAGLREFPRLGPVGAEIFCREAQQVWPELRPYFDRKALTGAGRVGLPTDAARLAELVDGSDLARLAAACVRVTLEKGVVERVTEPSPTG
ncbi:endonuclease [Actinopolyspora mortivallis]|uniref:Endonuclease n=1 Tax=Actinopolyspora mortivallis TaxID=33906 RepID=A0A2T0GV70_ACTMO|nr:endonuclease [Actinopolyspora mortivallis]PRW63002.1 endonuclease [Actinopolyspora mortivallis]